MVLWLRCEELQPTNSQHVVSASSAFKPCVQKAGIELERAELVCSVSGQLHLDEWAVQQLHWGMGSGL